MKIGQFLKVFAVVAWVSSSALAATRTVQFAGISASDARQGEVSSLNSIDAACHVVIANTGETNQIIDQIAFLYYNTLSLTVDSNWISPLVELLRTPTGSASTCVGQVLPPKGFCVARLNTGIIPIQAQVMVCSGRITVRDEDPATPGSVVAAGTIAMFHESMVRGGQFAGALYMSGVHMSTAPVATTNGDQIADHDAGSVTITSILPTEWAQQMNPYCEVGCQAMGAGNTWNECRTLCGGNNSIFDKLDSNSGITSFWTFRDTEGPASETTIDTGTPSPAGNQTVERNYIPQYGITTASGHYTGGMVFEISVGPFNSICSGLQAYFDEDGDDFRHSGSVDTHTVNKILGPGASIGFPPERLMCQHRHAFLDPFSSVGSSSSFSINGGNPF